VKNFKANLFLSTSLSCSKLLNDKKYIFNAVNTLCFSGQTQSCLKILNGKKYIQYSEKFRGNSVYSGQLQVAQKS